MLRRVVFDVFFDFLLRRPEPRQVNGQQQALESAVFVAVAFGLELVSGGREVVFWPWDVMMMLFDEVLGTICRLQSFGA